jgi:putative endonuclease
VLTNPFPNDIIKEILVGLFLMNYVYILSNKNKSVLYTGVTNNLERRLYEHRNEISNGFSNRYHLNELIYYEAFDHIRDAIQREKELKGWSRKKKVALIESMNPHWDDLIP